MLVREVGMWGVCACLFATGCDDGDSGGGSTSGADGTSTSPTSSTTAEPDPTTDPPETTGSGEDGSSSGGPPDGTTSGSSTSSGSTGGADTGGGSESGTTGAVAFDEEFVWVADFMRENCVQCHANDANGNIILPSVDMTNDEVRVALEGVVANSGLLLVEPGDRNASQTYLQITNEFGAQFPTKLTDRFGEWIDAGAPYFAE